MDENNAVWSVGDVAEWMDALYPPALKEDWDRVGLICGDRGEEVTKILLAVDPCEAVVDEALEWGADMVITHHPLFLRGTSFVSTDTAKGRVVHRLIRASVALFNAHTNADSARLGVAEALAEAAGLSANTWRPLQPRRDHPELGIGRVGPLSQPYTVGEIAERLSELLPASPAGILIGGDDAFVTADLRHHPASDFLEQESYLPDTRTVRPAPALIVPSHWASEWLWLGKLAAQLELCAALGPHAATSTGAEHATNTATKTITATTETTGPRPRIETRISQVISEPWDAYLPTVRQDVD